MPQYEISAEQSPARAATSAWASLACKTSERVLECIRREFFYWDTYLYCFGCVGHLVYYIIEINYDEEENTRNDKMDMLAKVLEDVTPILIRSLI